MIHTEFPIVFVGTEETIVKPALEGIKAVLKACRDFSVKKLIITSSSVTIQGPDIYREIYNESHWVDPESKNIMLYTRSKILIEKEIWEFHRNELKDSGLKISTLCPSLMLGKSKLVSYIASYLYN